MPARNIDSPFTLSRRITLARIDVLVTAYLGPARVDNKEQPAVFYRQIAMYLAKQVGGWSTTVIGRFYNGRDHSTVCHAIQRIKALRQVNPELDQMLSKLEKALQTPEPLVLDSLSSKRPASIRLSRLSDDMFLDELAARIADRLIRLQGQVASSDGPFLNGEKSAGRAHDYPETAN